MEDECSAAPQAASEDADSFTLPQPDDALRDSLRRVAVEVAQDAVIAIGEDGRILLFNPAAERMFGYTH